MNRAIFFDRDGTLNVDKGYTHKIKDFELFPGVINGLKLLSKTDYKLIIINNQAGIGKGFYTEKNAENFNKHLKKIVEENGGRINAIYFCPHKPEDNCTCRKPETGMLRKAQENFDLDLNKSFFIGDTTADIETGKRAGCITILVKTGLKGKDGKFNVESDFIAENLVEAAEWILKNDEK